MFSLSAIHVFMMCLCFQFDRVKTLLRHDICSFVPDGRNNSITSKISIVGERNIFTLQSSVVGLYLDPHPATKGSDVNRISCIQIFLVNTGSGSGYRSKRAFVAKKRFVLSSVSDPELFAESGSGIRVPDPERIRN